MISLKQTHEIIQSALAKGRELELNPLCVAVLDSGGHLVALSREDQASNLRPQIAIGKANGALALGVSSRTVGNMAVDRPHFVASLHNMTDGGVIPAAGGIIVTNDEGTILGAVGVTGDTSDNDEVAALAGVAAAGLHAQG